MYEQDDFCAWVKLINDIIRGETSLEVVQGLFNSLFLLEFLSFVSDLVQRGNNVCIITNETGHIIGHTKQLQTSLAQVGDLDGFYLGRVWQYSLITKDHSKEFNGK